MARPSIRVRRAWPSTQSVVALEGADFACAYEVDISPEDGRSPEQWARAAWEDSPSALRWFMRTGWRFVLGFRLGPRASPDHILGWPIVDRPPDEVVCRLRSGLLDAHNTFRRLDGVLVWSTFVRYEKPMARLVWMPASVLHRHIVRLALRRAAVRPIQDS
ncbi:MAG: DUF2867 domain-containing protein [Acidimicrobiia bacterium]|nr:DUF2867 domain-containing protein [Acidimicrobiia bacterium]